MKKQVRWGFTLVELLVVISIIGMLAGLLLPAVNAAREAGRRATCVSNQSNVALALLNYESARGSFPALRRTIHDSIGGANSTQASWVGQILAYIELNQAYEVLTRGGTIATTNTTAADAATYPLRSLSISVMKCKSSNQDARDQSIAYVVNGGYQNAYGTSWTAAASVFGSAMTTTRIDPGKKRDAVFFDHCAIKDVASAAATATWCTETVSVDYISSHSGTSQTILLSENVNAGNWISFSATNYAVSGAEEDVAFCYPINIKVASTDFAGTLDTFPGQNAATERSWYGYTAAPLFTGTNVLDQASYSPLFINVGRQYSYEPIVSGTAGTPGTDEIFKYRQARPSSNHPGIAVAAFADRSVRPLNENMNKDVFVRICQPYSGVIIDQNDIN